MINAELVNQVHTVHHRPRSLQTCWSIRCYVGRSDLSWCFSDHQLQTVLLILQWHQSEQQKPVFTEVHSRQVRYGFNVTILLTAGAMKGASALQPRVAKKAMVEDE